MAKKRRRRPTYKQVQSLTDNPGWGPDFNVYIVRRRGSASANALYKRLFTL